MTYYFDYPKQRIDKRNPYMACSHCHNSDPAINGRLEGHAEHCAYRLAKEAELRQLARQRGEPSIATLYFSIPSFGLLIDAEGNEICDDIHYYLFENLSKGEIVKAVVAYLDTIKQASNIMSQWDVTKEAFKLKLYAAYVEHTTTTPLENFLLVEQDDKNIHWDSRVSLRLEFSH